ncbi:UPF0147 family protein [Candidatus Bathyarchaeota archaeon]|nr:UPF0147 family protein [Candidatus Bathyarchaeota archaeon]
MAEVEAANAISILEEILEDRNMPSYARVKLLNVIAILETVRDWPGGSLNFCAYFYS